MPLTQFEARAILEQSGAILANNHFVLSSGLHSDTYIEKAEVTPHTKFVEDLAYGIALRYVHSDIDAVVSPAVGAIPIGFEVARVMTRLVARDQKEVLSYYAEKEGENDLVLKRGYYKKLEGLRVLLVDDLLTTGGSVTRLKKSLPTSAIIVAVAVLANRGGITAESLEVPELFSLTEISDIKTYPPGQECPMCREGKPINTEHGHGAKQNN